MHADCSSFDGVEDKIILDNEVSVPQTRQFFLLRAAAQHGVFRQKGKVLFDFVRQCLCCLRTIRRNIHYDLVEIVFRSSKQSDVVFKPAHGGAFGGPS